ncbi:aminotransferase class IV [Capillimicrobium parvum]|uniref:D-alanine aminotransferase n=1 Tax=Capillimicrobium parvum TaxID=2884022 RepID=A0A9E7C110_9ACTN|nr:aminotransferase class IV [Capillimicrobium parvum]UGS35953.1 D-alanine aminotransferase [Capillimicrobium parvum]
MDAANAFRDGAAYVDGAFVPVGEARISILDTGFSRSDVTYDVVAVWNGAFFRLEDHLERFERSCRTLRLSPPYDRAEIARILVQLVRSSRLRSAYVETICTRGVPPPGSRDPRTFENSFFAYAIPYVWIVPDASTTGTMDAVIARTVQRIPVTSVDPTVKNFHWADLTRGLYEAYDRGATHPILLDADGNVTEGPGYNVFAVSDGTLLTPAAGVLEGITRRTVLELAEADGIPVSVGPFGEDRLRDAVEMFATSTAGGVMPIVTLDGAPIGDGAVGPTTRHLRERYWAAHADTRYLTPVDYGDV